MPFHKILGAVCVGTKVFRELAGMSLARCGFHLLVLAALCAAGIMASRAFQLKKEIEVIRTAFKNSFGRLEITEAGIFPGVRPGQAKSILITDNIRIDYFPDQNFSLADLEKSGAVAGLIWQPNFITFYHRSHRDRFAAEPLVFKPARLKLLTQAPTYTARELENYIKLNAAPLPGAAGAPPANLEELKSLCRLLSFLLESALPLFWLLMVVSFLKFFGLILFSTLLYSLMSVLIFYLMSRDLRYLNTVKRLLVVAVYAGFPGIIIASTFPALRLPLLDYQTVYLVCFLAYFFVIINQLETKSDKSVK